MQAEHAECVDQELQRLGVLTPSLTIASKLTPTISMSSSTFNSPSCTSTPTTTDIGKSDFVTADRSEAAELADRLRKLMEDRHELVHRERELVMLETLLGYIFRYVSNHPHSRLTMCHRHLSYHRRNRQAIPDLLKSLQPSLRENSAIKVGLTPDLKKTRLQLRQIVDEVASDECCQILQTPLTIKENVDVFVLGHYDRCRQHFREQIAVLQQLQRDIVTKIDEISTKASG